MSQTAEERKAYHKAYNARHRGERAAYAKAYNAAHPGENAARKKAYNAAHREKRKGSRLKYKYGLSESAKKSLLDDQGGVCAICKKPNWNSKGSTVDHDHVSGKVRGILCQYCNTALGMIRDDPKIAQAMVEYLNKFREGGTNESN